MKKFKFLFIITSFIFFCTNASAQKCYIPKQITVEQVKTVKGIWKGSYQYEGKDYPMMVTLYTNNNTTCSIEAPPIPGKETGEQIRFCDGGEFHFKKFVGQVSYEFQGTPVNGKMKGILTIRNDEGKVGKNGKFVLERI